MNQVKVEKLKSFFVISCNRLFLYNQETNECGVDLKRAIQYETYEKAVDGIVDHWIYGFGGFYQVEKVFDTFHSLPGNLN